MKVILSSAKAFKLTLRMQNNASWLRSLIDLNSLSRVRELPLPNVVFYIYFRLIYNLTHRGMFKVKYERMIAGYYRSRI